MTRQAVACMLLLWPGLALAGLTQAQIGEVSLQPPAGARVPPALTFRDSGGHAVTIGEAIGGRPTVLFPVDFTCRQICGPALSVAASSLDKTGLRAGIDYSLVVVGLDDRDDIADARRFADGQVGGVGVSVLTGDERNTDALMGAIGYRFVRDAGNDSIAHPAGFVTLTADGRVTRALSSLALQPNDLRLALIEAGEGRVGGIAGRLALLCYGFDAVHGVYTSRIITLLQIAGVATVLAIAMALGILMLRARKREASS